MKVLVLGAGVVGVTSAWYLAEDGHEVTLVDRQPGAGLETSFANGGQISVSQAEPWSNPGAPAKILKWLGDEEAPLLFRPMASTRQWAWGLRFLYECLPGRTRENTLQILQLAIYSGAQLKLLREKTGIRYDHLQRGLLQIYYDAQEFERAKQRAELIRNRGLDLQVKDAQQCLALEPALGYSKVKPVGGTYAPSDESGDAHLFTRNLAQLCAQRGVQLRYDVTIERLEARDGKVTGVRARSADAAAELLRADAVLVCLGTWTPFLLEPLGIRVPIYPGEGLLHHRPGRASRPRTQRVPHRRGSQARHLPAGGSAQGGGNRRAQRLRHDDQRAALQRADRARQGPVPRCRRLRAGAALGRAAAGDARQCSRHRGHALPQPLRQRRSRHAGLDAVRRLGPGDRGHRRRAQAASGLPVPAREPLELSSSSPRSGHWIQSTHHR